MKKNNTKQVIMEEALNLFAVHGYEGVSVAKIADAVGIKASSLYKHYKNKQDIFNSILAEMTVRYKEAAESLSIEGDNAEIAAEQFTDMSVENLLSAATGLFLYFLHDGYAAKFRRMLTVEQYNNPSASTLYADQYIDSPLLYQSTLFGTFMNRGNMRVFDTKVSAMHFYAPIFLMLSLCDNCPDREAEALETIKRHIVQFRALYMAEESQ